MNNLRDLRKHGTIVVLVAIPYKDEAESLQVLLPLLRSEIEKVQSKFPNAIEINVALVNDRSEDGGDDFVKNFVSVLPTWFSLNASWAGQTGAFKTIFNTFIADVFLRMDADMQDNPKELEKFCEEVLNDSDIVLGIRKNRQHNPVLRFATRVYDFIVVTFFKSPFKTASCSFAAYKWELLRDFDFRGNDHRYLAMIALRFGANKYSEIQIEHHERHGGVSKYALTRKLFLGPFELFLFLIRLKRNNRPKTYLHSLL